MYIIIFDSNSWFRGLWNMQLHNDNMIIIFVYICILYDIGLYIVFYNVLCMQIKPSNTQVVLYFWKIFIISILSLLFIAISAIVSITKILLILFYYNLWEYNKIYNYLIKLMSGRYFKRMKIFQKDIDPKYFCYFGEKKKFSQHQTKIIF